MIHITDKQQCCGCASCVNRCPKQCISLQEDNEGFLYPVVDSSTCVNCGLCEKVCPFLNSYEGRKPLQVFAAINKDEKIRMDSSSGGIFSILAESVIEVGGVVFGARFDEDWQVTLDYTETIEGLAAFRGSKYVQARTADTYSQCEKFLKDERKVLFTGTPCQVAGLKHYLRKEYDNLITCDFVCHGVPSPMVWSLYLDEVLSGAKKSIHNIEFRNKSNGWKKFNFVLESQDTTISAYHQKNHYMRAFLDDMILRPSCYECKAKQGRSKSDITIADYWGIENIHREMDDDKGASLLLINTKAGSILIDSIEMYKLESDYEYASVKNKGLSATPKPHYNRDLFFQKLTYRRSVINWIETCLKPSLLRKRTVLHPISSIIQIIKLHVNEN